MIVIAVYNTDSASWWYLVYITFLMIASCEFVVIQVRKHQKTNVYRRYVLGNNTSLQTYWYKCCMGTDQHLSYAHKNIHENTLLSISMHFEWMYCIILAIISWIKRNVHYALHTYTIQFAFKTQKCKLLTVQLNHGLPCLPTQPAKFLITQP